MNARTWMFEATADSKMQVTHNGHFLKAVPVSIPREAYGVRLGQQLPDRLADLVDIAVISYAADRLAPRRRSRSQTRLSQWQRRLILKVPVGDLVFWQRPEVSEKLEACLAYLTEDEWTFEFLSRATPEGRKPIQRFLPSEGSVGAALFSGGLDSLAGAAIDIEEKKFRRLVLVACVASSRLLNKQRNILAAIYRRHSGILPIILPCRISQDRKSYNSNERTQRARGFLYGCLGAVGAVQAGASSLRIYENGVGSINLPMTPAQLGVQATRATHPQFVLSLSQVLSHVFDRPFEIQLPFIYNTKGEMCSRLAATRWRDLACETVSCDGFPLRRSDGDQCGVCTSCLLRRQALFVGGFLEDQLRDIYRFDMMGPTNEVPAEQQRPLANMLMQVYRLRRALSSPSPWEELQSEFPDICRVPSFLPDQRLDDHKRRIVDLYTRYCQEWQYFPALPTGWEVAAA